MCVCVLCVCCVSMEWIISISYNISRRDMADWLALPLRRFVPEGECLSISHIPPGDVIIDSWPARLALESPTIANVPWPVAIDSAAL